MVNFGQSVLPLWSDGVGGVPLNPWLSWQRLPLAEVLPRLSRFPNETHWVHEWMLFALARASLALGTEDMCRGCSLGV